MLMGKITGLVVEIYTRLTRVMEAGWRGGWGLERSEKGGLK